ncbi:hypothetical protein glysoja_042105 [Glycine soja]|uniref:Uncharacterized protein n=1 Tax=Glycine soja TaxID=3848 RepID=A0A0B2P663_GLYSO|nr:hypothetical protein glysoja_042105 [Glycine soja]
MEFYPDPLLPITSQIESALVNVHKQWVTNLANMDVQGRLQLLIRILPDVKGSYGECLACSN